MIEMSRRKKSKIAKGLLIGDKAELMRKSITGVDVGGKRWEEETAKGTTYWTYWMKMVMPIINGVTTMQGLTKDQKMLAVKETLKIISDTFEDYLISCAYKGVAHAKTMIPVKASSPLVIASPELIV